MPVPSTGQTVMKTKNGDELILNTNSVLAGLIYYPYYKVISASTTLTANLTGAVVLVYGQTAAVVVTLPAISTGPFTFRVINGAAQDITITAETADTMIGFNDVDLDSTAITASGSEIGGHFQIDCDGTKLFVLPLLACTYQATVFND